MVFITCLLSACLPLMDHSFVIHTFYSKVAHGADCRDNLSLDFGIPTTIFLLGYLKIIWILEPEWCTPHKNILYAFILFWALTAVTAAVPCPGREHWKSGGDRLMSSFCTAKFLWLWKWWMGPIFYTELQLIKYWAWKLKWSGIEISWMEERRGQSWWSVCIVVAT